MGESGRDPQQRAAPRLARAKHDDELATLDRERDASQGHVLASAAPEALAHALQREQAHAPPPPGSALCADVALA